MKSIKKFFKKLIGGDSSDQPKRSKSSEQQPAKRDAGDWSPGDKTKPRSKKKSSNSEGKSGVRRESRRGGGGRRQPRSDSQGDSNSHEGSGEGQRRRRNDNRSNDSRGRGKGGGGRRGQRSEPKSRESAEDASAPNMPDPTEWTAADASSIDLPEDYSFSALGLSDVFAKAVFDAGYTTPTEIQEKSIPLILEGKDIIGASQTGTGKTAAFGLPVLDKMKSHGKLRCLILEPTRELAAQVEDAFNSFSQFTDLRCALIHGGVGYGKQNEFMKRGIDTVVATPGRLLDHMAQGTIDLSDLEYLILDEVDRMLDMGFLPDVRKIVEQCPKNRQTLFFSATMPPQIATLAAFALKEPEKIEVGRRFSPADTVSHAFYPVANEQRNELLMGMLKKTDFNSVMIFTRTKAEADKVHNMIELDGEHKSTVMHSDIRQTQRTKALKGFKNGEFQIIVATDVAARGLDISDVSHVINYRVPENAEDYVHRIGRTGRANKTGDAFTILSGDEIEFVESIERFIEAKIPRNRLEGFNYIYTAMLDDDVPSDPDAIKKALGRSRRGGGGRKRRR